MATLTPPEVPPFWLELVAPLQPTRRVAATHVMKIPFTRPITHLIMLQSVLRLACTSELGGKPVFCVTYGLPVPQDRHRGHAL